MKQTSTDLHIDLMWSCKTSKCIVWTLHYIFNTYESFNLKGDKNLKTGKSPIRTPDGSWDQTSENKVNVFTEHLPTSWGNNETETENYLDKTYQLPAPDKAFM